MRKIEKRYMLSVLVLSAAANVAQAVSLDGRLYIDGFIDDADGYYADGSYFAMGSNNPNGQVGSLQPAASGGYIELGNI
jgi:hypothetical protein